MDDALCFSNLPQIGPNTNLEFPDDRHLLVDLGYYSRYPLMTQYRRLQHLIKEIKIMRVVSGHTRGR